MKAWSWLVLSFLVAAITWVYVDQIFNPWAIYVRAKGTVMVAEMGDLYSPWVATRELLLRRQNPYSQEVTHEIQNAFYGHPVDQTYETGTTVINEQRFAYPVYVVFLMSPTVHANFSYLRRCAAFALAFLTAGSVFLYLDVLHWHPPWPVRIAISICVLACPQTLQGLRLQQLGLLVGFLVALALWCAQTNHLVSAGIVLACASIKPQMSVIALSFFLLWSFGEWKKRWPLFASFVATLSCLVGAGELLLPGWIGLFSKTAAAYPKYSPSFTSFFRIVFGITVADLLGIVILLALLASVWRHRRVSASAQEFVTVFSAFLIGTLLAFPLFAPFNQILLILPTLLLLYSWETVPKLSRLVFTAAIVWPWVTSSILIIFRPNLHSTSQWPLLPSFVPLFYPLLLPLLLMARRPHANRSAAQVTSPYGHHGIRDHIPS
jgi:hypothetical protein